MEKERDFYIEDVRGTERNRRNRIAASFAPILLSVVLLLYPLIFQFPKSQGLFTPLDEFIVKVLFTYAPISLIVLGLGNLLYWYLQTGFDNVIERTRILDISQNKNLKNESRKDQNTPSENLAHEEEITTIKLQITELKNLLSPELTSLEHLTHHIKEKIENEAGEKLLKEFRERYEKETNIEHAEQKFNRTHATSVERLRTEIDSLGRRGNVNLALGVTTTLVGLALLTIFIFKNEELAAGSIPYAINFLPRLTLVIFIEVFAYFFLRLYKAGLAEIKYFQNELTNLESKHMALLAALRCENGNTLTKVIEIFAKTERNHILEKGQSTTELKKIELEKNQFVEITKALAAISPKTK